MDENVRFGGRFESGVYQFELTGGHAVLDLLNTLDERGGARKELLSDFERVLEWGEQTGILSVAERARLKHLAHHKSANAEHSVRELK